MSLAKKALILFAKAPKPGQVKTRLQPYLTVDQASRLYKAFVLDLLDATGRLKDVTRIVACDPAGQDPFFRSLAQRCPVVLTDQQGASLGERMQNAMAGAHRQGFRQVVIIGTDSPTLPMEFVRQAFSLLRSQELVLGPSWDGGYYLIGCGKSVPPIFEGIPWGTDRVLALTLKRISELKLKCGLLPFWYDVDRVEDLRFLAAHLHYLEWQAGGVSAPETAQIIKAFKLE